MPSEADILFNESTFKLMIKQVNSFCYELQKYIDERVSFLKDNIPVLSLSFCMEHNVPFPKKTHVYYLRQKELVQAIVHLEEYKIESTMKIEEFRNTRPLPQSCFPLSE